MNFGQLGDAVCRMAHGRAEDSHVVEVCSGLLERVGRWGRGVLVHQLAKAPHQYGLLRKGEVTDPCKLRLKLS